MAFVLVQHLDPTHESALTSLLSRLTEMPVSEARNNMPLRPDQIYVIPPNKLMGVANRRLKLSPRRDAKSHLSVDEFFRTLAEEENNRAIGVVLSGNGSDGTHGLLAIKAAGGITFAQDEKSAKYPAMPASAIAAGCVDFVLPPERIGRELARIAGHPYVMPGDRDETPELERPAEEKAFEEVLLILRQRTTVDFSQYKHATLKRRIHRRMVLRKIDSLKEYSALLRAEVPEVKELFSDILIHVTGFFRDLGVFQALKKKLFPRIIKNKPPDEPIRIWVPGCSTGEEVYSIAITLTELMSERKLDNPVHIFGTDIHDTALEKARMGLYPEIIKADVSAERLRRFFVRTEEGMRINKSIREMCIFARQNLVVDPPFSNLDLISCRNVLIYLGQPLQRKVFPLFHYALKPNAVLMLGASESVGGFSDLFALLDKRAKIYVKKGTQIRPGVSFAQSPPQLHAIPARLKSGAPAPVSPTLSDVQKQAERILLNYYSPAGVIINKHMDVLQFRGHTGPYLEHADGEASLNLLKMVRPELVFELRTAVTRAIRQNARVRQPGIGVKENGHTLQVALEIVPYTVPPSSEKFFLVLFQPFVTEEASEETKGRLKKSRAPETSRRLARVEEELAATRESLQSNIEEQEATVEELRSANEEIMSSNEELQSTNEELETAKEELQSTNEELITLNDELQSRNSELEHLNNDLHNVLGSVNIPIIILGADLRIRRFTSVAEKVFNLIPGDIGRPITDINLSLEIDDLSKIVLEVIDTFTSRELEVQDRSGHWWSMRVRPYKTTDNKIEGSVVALVDIDLIKRGAQETIRARTVAEALINTMPRPMLALDPDLNVQAANQAFYETFHVSPEDTLNRRIYRLGNGQWDIPKLRTLLEQILPEKSTFKNFKVEHNFPEIGHKTMLIEARRLPAQGEKVHLVLLAIDDITRGGEDLN